MSTEDEKLALFKGVAGTDDDGFATSFLEAHEWNVERAVNSFMGGGGAGAGGGGGGGNGSGGDGGGGMSDAEMAAAMAAEAPMDPQERAPLPQFREQLMDPAAHHMPAVSHEQQSSSASSALEAFRDFRAEGQMGDGDGDNGERFGQRKRPRNLAELYRQPTEMCFKGSFEQLREEGKRSSKWLLVNIQSPTEFASQQLNADVWTDETLRAVVAASFLFWQQYFDSELGTCAPLQHAPPYTAACPLSATPAYLGPRCAPHARRYAQGTHAAACSCTLTHIDAGCSPGACRRHLLPALPAVGPRRAAAATHWHRRPGDRPARQAVGGLQVRRGPHGQTHAVCRRAAERRRLRHRRARRARCAR